MGKIELTPEEREEFALRDILKNYRPTYYYLSELVVIFPEVKKIIPPKLKELRGERTLVRKRIKRRVSIINRYAETAMGQYLASLLVEIDEEIEEDITRQIKHFLMIQAINPGRVKGTFEEKIEDARGRDILEVAGRHTDMVKAGKEWKGCCPLHEEDTPSFFVNPVKNMFYCHGCGEGGDVIKLVQLTENADFKKAVEILAS